MNENKPTLGVKPYYIAAEIRIAELADCIIRHVGDEYPADTEHITVWAREIVQQCNLIRAMQEGKG